MTNRLNKLRKENNMQDKQLSKENSPIMTDIICYLRASDLCEYDIEIIRKELIGMALESQLRGENFSDIVGDDKKAFCMELMENGRQKTNYEKILGILYTITNALLVLYIAEIMLSSTIFNILKYNQFTMPITLSFVVMTLFAVGMGYFVYYYFTKNSHETLKKNRKTQILFLAGFTILWAAALLFRYLFDQMVIINVNCLYPLVAFAVAFAIIKFLNNQYENSFFTESN